MKARGLDQLSMLSETERQQLLNELNEVNATGGGIARNPERRRVDRGAQRLRPGERGPGGLRQFPAPNAPSHSSRRRPAAERIATLHDWRRVGGSGSHPNGPHQRGTGGRRRVRGPLFRRRSPRCTTMGNGDVSAGEVPLVLQGQRDGHRIVVLGFDPGLSHMSQAAALPLLVANAVAWTTAPLTGVTVDPGEPVLLPVPSGASAIVVQRPDGTTSPADVLGTTAIWRDTERLGPYVARAETGSESQPVQTFDVRLPDAESIDVTPVGHPEVQARGPRPPEPGHARSGPGSWSWLARWRGPSGGTGRGVAESGVTLGSPGDCCSSWRCRDWWLSVGGEVRRWGGIDATPRWRSDCSCSACLRLRWPTHASLSPTDGCRLSLLWTCRWTGRRGSR